MSPLHVDYSLAKKVWRSAAEGELRRVLLGKGDVVVTIKRRIVDACSIDRVARPTVVNQDVAVLTPNPKCLPGFVAAALVSRVGKAQAFRTQTEQMNPYISVGSLGTLLIPVADVDEQEPIQALVDERLRYLRRAEEDFAQSEALLASALGLTDRSAPDLYRIAKKSDATEAGRWDAEFFCWPELTRNWKSPFLLRQLGDPEVTSWLSNGATPAADEYDASRGIPIIKVAGISAHGTAEWLGDRVRPNAQTAKGPRGETRPGDVLMLCAAHHVRYIGKSGVLRAAPDGGMCRSVGELITVRPAKRFRPEALCTYFNLPPVQTHIQRFVRGQSAHLYPSDLTRLPVPMLPEALQANIAKLHEKADADRSRAARLLEEATAAVEALVHRKRSRR